MHQSQRRCVLTAFLAAGALAPGCGDYPTIDEIEVSTRALVEYRYEYSSVLTDDSASPVHVAITECVTTQNATAQNVDCPAHHGYALVAGGAQVVQPSSGTALLTESRPIDPYYWRARSKTHVGQNGHGLHVFALGIRLDGVNVQNIRDIMPQIYQRSTYSAYSTSDVYPYSYVLSGGIELDSDVFVKSTKWTTGNGWYVEGKDHLQDANYFVRMTVTTFPKGIIEGFGALEMAQRKSTRTYSASGRKLVSASATTGWSIVGFGGEAETSSGKGRLLYGYGPADGSARQLTAASADDSTASAGYTTAYSMEARKLAGSHGVCNVGTKLSASMDSCVAKICTALPKCCNTQWDSSCVARVQTDCGSFCSSYTCSAPTFDPNWWNTPERDVNCYAYALNTTTYPGGAPGFSYWYYPAYTVEDMRFALAGEGLIPTTATATCPEGRTKIAALLQPDQSDYHFLRRDQGGNWSHKFSGAPPKNIDNNNTVISNPERAVISAGPGSQPYSVFAGYYCACQDSRQGMGHTRIARTDIPCPWSDTGWCW
jgi:hypothetical protein